MLIKKIKKEDVIIFLVSCAILLFFLYVFAPGILTYDSYNQLNQIRTGTFTNWHPFFHTFIELWLLKIWNNPMMIAIFQILVFAILWTIICKYNRKDKSTKNFIFQLLLTIIICINPLNFLYSITLWKDILFSYTLLLVCFLIELIIDNKVKWTTSFAFIISLSFAFLAKLRANGFFVTIILLIIFTIYFYKKNKKSYMFIKVPAITIGAILLISSLDLVYAVKDNEKDALEPKVMQYLSFFLTKDKISPADMKTIAEIADIEELKEEYVSTYSDNTYRAVEHEKYKEKELEMLNLCLKYTFKYPDLFIRFAFSSTSFIWNPIFPDDDYGLIFSTDITSTNNTEDIKPYHVDSPMYQKINSILNETLNNSFLKTILYSPAFYFYLSLIIMLILFIKFHYKTLLIVLPNLLNLLIVAVSNPIHDVRYIYPNILIFYFLFIILLKKVVSKHERKIEEVA